METKERIAVAEERNAKALNGMGMLFFNILFCLGTLAVIIVGCAAVAEAEGSGVLFWVLIVSTTLHIISYILFAGLKILGPNEAYVFILFGKYYGTLKGPGFFFVNPFVSALKLPEKTTGLVGSEADVTINAAKSRTNENINLKPRKMSLKAITLCNEKQKINDAMGNPIIIGIIVVWRVIDTAKAAFNVDNYYEYISIQADSALRNIVREYPYDSPDEDVMDLRGSAAEIAACLKDELQQKVDIAGLQVMETTITNLSYAPEIAAAMLQRQQATAVVDAKQMIVEGAVGMVEQALNRLGERNIINLDDERKAAMVSNLLVVLCGNKEAQPVVNSGSLY